MYKTVIFDLDGTLLDTLQDLHASANAALAAYGLPSRSVEEVRSFVGNGIAKLIERSIGRADHPDFEGVLSAFKAHYGAHCKDKTKPYEGILALLQKLQAFSESAFSVLQPREFLIRSARSAVKQKLLMQCLPK